MSGRLTRPRRTKMYDCNYNLSERYYKPMVDHLDRKYSTAPSLDRELSDIPRHYSPLADGRRRQDKSPDVEARRRPLSTVLDEFEADTRASNRFDRRAAQLQEEEDEETSATMRRIQASRAARAQIEEEISEISSRKNRGKAASSQSDYADKLFDSVGIKNNEVVDKLRSTLEEETFFKRRPIKLVDAGDDEETGLTKWTALNLKSRRNQDLIEPDDGPTALMRARQSRNRLADLDAEMEQVADRTAQREKRNNHLRALVQENHENSEAALSSSIRVKKTTIKSEKKVVSF